MSLSIHIENLSQQYPGVDFKVLENFSLDIQKGSIFGLLGPNGSGKTTLISILTGLLPLQHGKVTIEGYDLVRDIRKIRHIMGMVPQEYAIYPKLTAKENLEFFGSLYGVKGKDLKSRIEQGMESMGLTDFADRKIESFSGGMKRRINLLAGLLHRPQLLFLDEPTVGVDVNSKQFIINYLEELNQKEGVSIFYTSHMMHEAQTFCTHLGLLNQGVISFTGTTQEILDMHENKMSLEEIFVENTKNV
ncbi:MAG: ABC transporter ATP-binding protein [Brumimicrobium sp.]|nr:ABC transporter ATP-binding protein [Brumimicrobium sp.]